jgi:hypothetical protein
MTKEARMTTNEDELTAADADPRDDDDLVDNLLEHDARFRRMLEERQKEKSVSIDDARKRLS